MWLRYLLPRLQEPRKLSANLVQTNTMKKAALIFIFFASSLGLYAQPEDPDAPTPFGLIELLVGAGALYGGRKVYNRRIPPK